MSKQRKLTATIKDPANQATAAGYGFANYLGDLDGNLHAFPGHRLTIELQPETTFKEADELVRKDIK